MIDDLAVSNTGWYTCGHNDLVSFLPNASTAGWAVSPLISEYSYCYQRGISMVRARIGRIPPPTPLEGVFWYVRGAQQNRTEQIEEA